MIERKTIFSPCRKYRYTLWRDWASDLLCGMEPCDGCNQAKTYVQFIGLNPSTADETADDPTIRRCQAFAKSWGYGAMCMTNLFAWRETDSTLLPKASDPIGPDNDIWLERISREAQIIIAAWGCRGHFMGRWRDVMKLIPNLHCIRKTKKGNPEHPLYLPQVLKPVPFSPKL